MYTLLQNLLYPLYGHTYQLELISDTVATDELLCDINWGHRSQWFYIQKNKFKLTDFEQKSTSV
jgi:hypothetical protein